MRSLHSATTVEPPFSLQLEKSPHSNQGPVQPKIKKSLIKKKIQVKKKEFLRQKLREFVASTSALQERLKEKKNNRVQKFESI